MSVTAVVVDDSATARQLISYHLHKAGCAMVGEATNAADALKLLRDIKPDIVTVDLMMPNKDNLDSMALVQAIKKEMPAVAIIVVSVIPFDKVRQSFIEEGVFAYIVKPFNDYAVEFLRAKLRRAFPELAAAR
jgi:two-component system chemotaxis response regulator CheY